MDSNNWSGGSIMIFFFYSFMYSYLRTGGFNMKKKLVVLMLSAAMTATLLTGCGFVCDNYGRSKFFSAVYDTVSDCIYFFQACDCTCFIIGQGIQNHLDGFFMCRHGSFCDFFVASCFLVYQSSVDSDSLTETFCQNFFCIGVDQLIFQR